MQKCTDDIKFWMTLDKFKLNDDRTEAMIASSWKSRSLSFSFQDFIIVGCASVPLSDAVKNLGVRLDCRMTMKPCVFNLVRSANFELRCISSIRHLLSTNATKTLCLCLCSFTSWLLHLSSSWLSSISPKQTTEGSEQCRSPCSESF